MSALLPTYARSELSFARGEGAYLFTASGERYLDFASGVAVTALGHAHLHLVKALSEQARKLWHVSNLHRIPEQERLAELAKFEKTTRRTPNGPLAAPDPKALARTYLGRAGFNPNELEAAGPALETAAKNHAFEKQLHTPAAPDRPWMK